MKHFSKISLFSLLAALAALASCIKEIQYPVEPIIKYEQFQVAKSVDNYDSLGRITISYTDGDGDIGLFKYDTVEPLKYNFYLKFLYMKNGELVELVPVDPSLGFNARIPILTPSGRNKNIKGEISLDLPLYYAWPVLESDTIGFEIYIKDRALHSSNTVQSPLFIIQKP